MPRERSAPCRIFVRLPNWVGDAVMATPALRALRAAHPQAEITALRPFDMFGLAEPPLHAERGAGHQQRVGGIGARGAGTGDQVGEQVELVHDVAVPSTRARRRRARRRPM